MNKIFLIIFLLIIIVMAGYFARPLWVGENKGTDLEEVATTTTVSMSPVGLQLMGTEFVVPGVGVKVRLTADIVDYEEGENVGSVIYLPKDAVTVVEGGKTFVAAPVAVNTGGTGTFVYLVLFEKTGTTFRQVDDESIGDRIKIEKVETEDGEIAVTIYDRRPDEAFSALPTVKKVLVFTISGGQLQVETENEN